jgi:hypothetical protein
MELVLSSDLCAIHFDADTGALLGIRDIERKVGFLDPGKGTQPPFRFPGLAALRLTDARLAPSARGEGVRLVFETDGLLFLLRVSIGFRSALSSWSLQVRNCGRASRSLCVEFPLIAGTGGSLFNGGPDWPARWIAVADPSGRAGLGLVVRDRKASPKTLLVEAGSVRVRYDSPFPILPGRAVRLPETTVLVSEPDWRPTARVHGAWQGAPRGAKRSAALPLALQFEALPPESLLPLRMSFPRLVLTSGNPVDASLAGIACKSSAEGGDSGPLARHWTCAYASAREALCGGEVCDDPQTDDPGIVTRMFRGPRMDAIVAARLEDRNGEAHAAGIGGPVDGPVGGRLADFHAPFEIRIPVTGTNIPEVAVCDLEDLSWSRHVPIVSGGRFAIGTSSNWLLCLVLGGKRRIVGFDPPAETAPGGVVVIRVDAIAGTGKAKRVLCAAPGLLAAFTVAIGGEIVIPVPPGIRAGFYPLSLRGKNVPPFTRFLHVLG